MLLALEYYLGDRLVHVNREEAEGGEALPIVLRNRQIALVEWGLTAGHALSEKWPGRIVTLPEGGTVPLETVRDRWLHYYPVPVKLAISAFITINEGPIHYRTALKRGQFIQGAYIELGIAHRVYVVTVPVPRGCEHKATEWPRVIGLYGSNGSRQTGPKNGI